MSPPPAFHSRPTCTPWQATLIARLLGTEDVFLRFGRTTSDPWVKDKQYPTFVRCTKVGSGGVALGVVDSSTVSVLNFLLARSGQALADAGLHKVHGYAARPVSLCIRARLCDVTRVLDPCELMNALGTQLEGAGRITVPFVNGAESDVELVFGAEPLAVVASNPEFGGPTTSAPPVGAGSSSPAPSAAVDCGVTRVPAHPSLQVVATMPICCACWRVPCPGDLAHGRSRPGALLIQCFSVALWSCYRHATMSRCMSSQSS